MSVKNEKGTSGESVVLERSVADGVNASLFEKINLNPLSELSALEIWQDAQAMSEATADELLVNKYDDHYDDRFENLNRLLRDGVFNEVF